MAAPSTPAEEPELEDLFARAAAMRRGMDGATRRTFDSWPVYLQHSLFHGLSSDVVQVRALPLNDRLRVSEEWRHKGNEAARAGDWDAAQSHYERVAAVWEYVVSVDDSDEWRHKGITDDRVRRVTLEESVMAAVRGESPAAVATTDEPDKDDAGGEGTTLPPAAVASVESMMACVYNNMAQALLKCKDYGNARRAADACLSLDGDNMKALYRRAKALLDNPSSGSEVLPSAAADLSRVVALATTAGDTSLAAEATRMLGEVTAQMRRGDDVMRKAMSGGASRGGGAGVTSSGSQADTSAHAGDEAHGTDGEDGGSEEGGEDEFVDLSRVGGGEGAGKGEGGGTSGGPRSAVQELEEVLAEIDVLDAEELADVLEMLRAHRVKHADTLTLDTLQLDADVRGKLPVEELRHRVRQRIGDVIEKEKQAILRRRWLTRIVLAAVLLVVGVVVGGWLWQRGSSPTDSGLLSSLMQWLATLVSTYFPPRPMEEAKQAAFALGTSAGAAGHAAGMGEPDWHPQHDEL